MAPHRDINQLLNGSPADQPASTSTSPTSPETCPPSSSVPVISPVPPKSPFGNLPVGGASGEVEFDAAAIESFGGKLISQVGPKLTAARKHLNGNPRAVESGAFTTFCVALAHAYVQAVEFADVDLITKEKVLVDIDDKLKQTAKILREAERHSTIK